MRHPKRNNQKPTRPRAGVTGRRRGRGQLSLLEHALCPLDAEASLVLGLRHTSSYFYTDKNGHRKTSAAEVVCPFGLSASDELYLWGLLALTLSQPEADGEFHATPYYCLRMLGVIDTNDKRGGSGFQQFEQALRRLSVTTYLSDHFFDPVLCEHRKVSFGFLKYNLPLDPTSSRAWRLTWDPTFFAYAKVTNGGLFFDLDTYRGLDPASRRLFLLLSKLFWKSEHSPAFDVRHLCVNVVGLADTVATRDLKVKLARCLEALLAKEIISLPQGVGSVKDLYQKKGVGSYAVRLKRGPFFGRKSADSRKQDRVLSDSPLAVPLRSIGFDERAVAAILTRYKPELIREWADITLAARERHGERFFKRSPQAYFVDNIRKAGAGARTAPDWWLDLRKAEERKEWEAGRQKLGLFESAGKPDGADHGAGDEAEFEEYLRGEGRAAFLELVSEMAGEFKRSGNDDRDATAKACEHARVHLWNRFRGGKPTRHTSGPIPLENLFRKMTQKDKPK